VLDLHDKSEYVPANAATETHEDLFFFADAERGSFFVVEGTPRDMVSAALFKRDVLGHQRYDIDSTSHFIQNAVGVKGHKTLAGFCLEINKLPNPKTQYKKTKKRHGFHRF
jgi:hypothetical protein